jgi:hypothetical protein
MEMVGWKLEASNTMQNAIQRETDAHKLLYFSMRIIQ